MKTNYKITNVASVLLLCSSLFMFAGCATTSIGKLETPSGRPEVTIPNTNIQTVMDRVAAWLGSEGKPITETGVYTISTSFVKREFWSGAIAYKTVYTIVQNGENVSLYGATFDQRNDNEMKEQSYYDAMQKQLAEIADFIKKSNPY